LIFTVIAVGVAAMAAAAAGLAHGTGTSRASMLLPLGATLALGMLVMAYRRFEMFIAAILVLRASLDAARLTSSVAGGSGAGSPLDPAPLLSIICLFASGVWLVALYKEEHMNGRRLEVPKGLVMSLSALTGAGVLSLVTSRHLSATVEDILRLATVVALVLVLAQLLDRESAIRTVLTAVFASAIVPIGVGAWQHYHGVGLRIGGFVRTYATFQHPNPFSIYLCFLTILGVAVWGKVHGWRRVGLSVILAGLLMNLLFTYTRSAWIATLMGVLVVGIIQSKRLLALMWMGVIVIAIAVPSASSRFQDLGTATRASGTSGNSLIWRFEYWKQALELGGNPITGLGLGAVSAITDQAKEPHNDFIRAFVETGIIGLAAYIWMLLAMVSLSRRALRTATAGFPRSVAAGFAGTLAAFILLSAVSNVITQLVILLYFGAFAVCAWAAGRLAPAEDPVAA
jgi:putative inorganic carbon (hco3(-)) transporter